MSGECEMQRFELGEREFSSQAVWERWRGSGRGCEWGVLSKLSRRKARVLGTGTRPRPLGWGSLSTGGGGGGGSVYGH